MGYKCGSKLKKIFETLLSAKYAKQWKRVELRKMHANLIKMVFKSHEDPSLLTCIDI